MTRPTTTTLLALALLVTWSLSSGCAQDEDEDDASSGNETDSDSGSDSDSDSDSDTDSDTDTATDTAEGLTCEDFDECVEVPTGNGYACPDQDGQQADEQCLTVRACADKVLCISEAEACDLSCDTDEDCISLDTDPPIIDCVPAEGEAGGK